MIWETGLNQPSFFCSTPCSAVLFQSIFEARSVVFFFYLRLQLSLQETCGKRNLPTGNITLQATD